MRIARHLLALSAVWGACAGAQTLQQAEGRGACATDEELVVGGVTLQDTRSSVRKKLGNPRSMTKGKSEDDGGEYGTVTYTYKHLEIVFGRSGIERIATSSSRVKAARGITVGMTEKQVGERLGFAAGAAQGPFEVGLSACRPPGLAELHLAFASRAAGAEAALLIEVAVTNYGP
jgi:hypothetical protein